MDANTNGKSLAEYGDRTDIREMADRIKRMLPCGAKMSDGDALGLAQVGLAHDLDPFNKEVWLIFNEETGKSYGIMVGIQGWRKHSRKQADYWGIGGIGGFTRITDPEVMKGYGAGPDSIVYEYRIADSTTIEAWSNAVASIRRATGLPFDKVSSMVGPMPVSIGVGVFTLGEKTKMKPHQAAMYRAERDCLRRRFQIKFSLSASLPEMELDEDPDEMIESYAERIEESDGEAEPASKTQEQIMMELGYNM